MHMNRIVGKLIELIRPFYTPNARVMITLAQQILGLLRIESVQIYMEYFTEHCRHISLFQSVCRTRHTSVDPDGFGEGAKERCFPAAYLAGE